ncbi:MAG TPA: AAA family ATPase [Streptosporangiaceae bacterium]
MVTAGGRGGRFVGRDRELGELARALADPGSVVLVEGESGIGKTRLVGESLTALAGRPDEVLVAFCPPFRRPHTLGPVTDALRERVKSVAGLGLSALAGALRPLFPEWADDLPPAPEPAQDASAVRHRMFRALGELIACLPIAVLVVEDVHWADEATLEFLLYLASAPGPGPRPVLVVTCRPEDVPAGSLLPRLSRLAAGSAGPAGPGGLRLSLGPLDVADTGNLVSSLLAGERVSAEFAAFVHERTEGVPLAVEESVRLMADRADLSHGRGGWVRRSLTDIAVPPTVRDAVLERAGRLTGAAGAVLAAAAVLAESAEESLLAQVSELAADQVRAGLAEALRARLLVEDSRGLVSFRHALAAQAVYEDVPGPQRRQLHRRAGQALQARVPLPVTQLAWHFRKAGDSTQWCGYAEQAAGRALASGDEATVIDLVCDLINGPDLATRCCAAGLLDRVPFASIIDHGCFLDLLDLLRSSLAGGGYGPVEGKMRFHLGRILGYMGDHPAAEAELERAIPLLDGSPAQAAQAMGKLGRVQRAAELAAALAPAERVVVLLESATALVEQGEEAGWAVFDQLAVEAAKIGDARCLTSGPTMSGEVAMMWGRYDYARRQLTGGLNSAETHGQQRYRRLALVALARLDWLTGEWPRAVASARSLSGDDCGATGDLEVLLVLGLAAAAAGDSARAEELFRSVLAGSSESGFYSMEPAGVLARLLLAAGRVADALAVTAAPAAGLAAKQTWLWGADLVPARVNALTAAGQVDAAADLVTAFAAGVRGREAPAARAAVRQCQAILAEARGQPDRAATLFGRAARAWQRLPRPHEALLCQERQAACLLATDDHEAAVNLLAEASAGLSRLGATADADRVSRRLDDLSGLAAEGPAAVGRSGRSGGRGYGDRLSPRELEVAGLVVGGGTNRDIAGQLFLSPKTVARHLDSAMRKLGVRTRTALAVRLIEEGMVPASPGASTEQ